MRYPEQHRGRYRRVGPCPAGAGAEQSSTAPRFSVNGQRTTPRPANATRPTRLARIGSQGVHQAFRRLYRERQAVGHGVFCRHAPTDVDRQYHVVTRRQGRRLFVAPARLSHRDDQAGGAPDESQSAVAGPACAEPAQTRPAGSQNRPRSAQAVRTGKISKSQSCSGWAKLKEPPCKNQATTTRELMLTAVVVVVRARGDGRAPRAQAPVRPKMRNVHHTG